MRDYGIQAEEDSVIFERAAIEDRIIVFADTDFGTLLSQRQEQKPSVILFRRSLGHRPSEQVVILLANLATIQDALAEGSLGTRIK